VYEHDEVIWQLKAEGNKAIGSKRKISCPPVRFLERRPWMGVSTLILFSVFRFLKSQYNIIHYLKKFKLTKNILVLK